MLQRKHFILYITILKTDYVILYEQNSFIYISDNIVRITK